MELESDLKLALEKEYFLIGKRTFLGGVVLTAIAIYGISFSSAKLALENAAGKTSLALVEQAAQDAELIIKARNLTYETGEPYEAVYVKKSELWNGNVVNTAKLHCSQNEFLTGIEITYSAAGVSPNRVRTVNTLRAFCASKTQPK